MSVAAKSFIEKLAGYKKTLIVVFLFSLISLIMVQDSIEASINHFSFYFSESFLFSSFWWMFFPFGYLQYKFANSRLGNKWMYALFAIILTVIVHLFAFPLLVQFLSFLFLDHTFVFRQTFNYTLSEHLYQLILLYTVPLALYLLYKSKTRAGISEQRFSVVEVTEPDPVYITSLAITENNRHFSIAVADVLYFTASAPYVNVILGQKKYLVTDTLKSLSVKLPASDFVRIHKSSIVNIRHVKLFASRLNGDYDITLNDGTGLRVSRNYARNFKERFNQHHQVTVK
jgi:LytTr DNA-binding domain